MVAGGQDPAEAEEGLEDGEEEEEEDTTTALVKFTLGGKKEKDTIIPFYFILFYFILFYL